jgi:hypothetical protein
MVAILPFLSSMVKPLTDLVDDLHTSKEEKLTLRHEITKIETAFAGKLLDYETKLVEAQSSIVGKEATGHSWLQRNWRPITMLTFLALVVLDSLGLLHSDLRPEAWTLLQIGLGGYVVGRSAEKMMPALLEAGRRRGTAGGGAMGAVGAVG